MTAATWGAIALATVVVAWWVWHRVTTQPARWAATWHEEARALGLRAVDAPGGPPLLEGMLDGREARIRAVRADGDWRVRVELRIAGAGDSAVDPLRRALASLAGDGGDGALSVEEQGRHDRPGQLRTLTRRALEGARALERLD